VSKNKFWIIGSLSLLLMLLTSAQGIGQETLAIKGGKIITLAGDDIEGGTIVIRDGKITAIGKDLEIPVDARVIDAAGKVVMPGFVEAHSSEAMSQANETNPFVPYVSVMDSVDPMRPYFDEARRNGVTSVAVVPGNSTMIGGQAAVLKTGGQFVEYMVLKRNAGVKISLRPIGTSSRMGHLAALRKALEDAREKRESADSKDKDKEGDDTKEGDDDEEGDDDKDDDEEGDEGDTEAASKPANPTQSELDKSMLQLVSGNLPAFIYCENAMDVENALALIKDFGIKPLLVLGKDCHKAAKLVADSGYPVILDSTLVFWDRDERTMEEERVVVTEAFRNHDVPFAFQVARANQNTLGNNYLWYQAATAVKYGMAKDDALKSLTILPARFLGVDKFVGSLEVGKDGDVIVLTGDPLKVDTWVENTIVNGQVVYERENDTKLQRLLGASSDN